LSKVSAPIRIGNDLGMKSLNTTAISALATPSSENSLALDLSRLVSQLNRPHQRAIIFNALKVYATRSIQREVPPGDD
jgi:hypothetical protein